MVNILKQNIGIDISMENFDATFVSLTNEQEIIIKGEKKFANSLKGFKAFYKWTEARKDKDIPISFTMEATGVYYEELAYFLKEQKEVVHVVLPIKAKKFIESLDGNSKTDKIDAKKLGQMGCERKLRTWELLSPNLRKLKMLTRERDSLIQEGTVIKNQLHAIKHSSMFLKDSVKRYDKRIEFLKKQIKQIEKEINLLIDQDDELKNKIQKITTIPGVGIITAVIIISDTNGFASIKSIKQLSIYAGLDVKLSQSGKWKGKPKISKKGNSHIRKALYFPAFSIVRYSKCYNMFYKRIEDKNNKSKCMIAYVAVQRKILGLIYTIWKNDTIYDSNYIIKKSSKKIIIPATQDNLKKVS